MDDTIVPVALFLSFTVGIIAVTRIISDSRTRRRLIEAGASPELARLIISGSATDHGVQAALQWGLVTGAVGLAFVTIQYMPFQPGEPISYGILLLFASAGLIGYHVIGRRMLRSRATGTQ